MIRKLITYKSTAGHADQTYTVSHAAAESAPVTVGGAIVPTLAESRHIGNGKNNV